MASKDSGQPHVRYSLDPGLGGDATPLSLAADADYGSDVDLSALDLNGCGYRWIRLRRFL